MLRCSGSEYQVRAGSQYIEAGGQLLNVSKLIIHERYHGNYSYNIALLKTGQKIKFGAQTRPVRLSKYEPETGRNYTVVGFDDDSRNVSVRVSRFCINLLDTNR